MEMSGYLYKCSAGESFDAIALALYGHEKYAADLMNANPEHVRTMVFLGGETLKLPVVVAEDENDATSAPTVAPWK